MDMRRICGNAIILFYCLCFKPINQRFLIVIYKTWLAPLASRVYKCSLKLVRVCFKQEEISVTISG